MPLPYRRPGRWSKRATDRLLATTALGLALVLGPVTIATWRTPTPAATTVHAAPAPRWGPSGSAFGTYPSSGDAVVDCGELADHTDDLSDAALEVVERCLDLHGWTYEN